MHSSRACRFGVSIPTSGSGETDGYHPAIGRSNETEPAKSAWTFFTNHGLVLLAIAQDPRARLRDITAQVGITERAVRRIIDELVEGGYVSRRREGRRNTYVVHRGKALRHPMEQHRTIGAMLEGMVAAHIAGVTKKTLPRRR